MTKVLTYSWRTGRCNFLLGIAACPTSSSAHGSAAGLTTVQCHQPGTTNHQRFAPLILERPLVAEQWQGRLPATPAASCLYPLQLLLGLVILPPHLILPPQPEPKTSFFCLLRKLCCGPSQISSYHACVSQKASLTAPQSLGSQPPQGKRWSSSQLPDTQKPARHIWPFYAQRQPRSPLLMELWVRWVAFVDHTTMSGWRDVMVILVGKPELLVKVNPHVPLLVRGKRPCYFSWPGVTLPLPYLDKVALALCWWQLFSALSAPLQNLSQLSQDLVMAPSVAYLGQCDLAAWQDVLEACIGSITEWALFLISEPLVKVTRAGERVINGTNKEAEPHLWDLPQIRPTDVAMDNSLPSCPASLAALRNGLDLITLFLSSCHLCHHHLFPLLAGGFGPEPWRISPSYIYYIYML